MGEHWKSLQVKDFDLRLTIESGQFFRYYRDKEAYLLLTRGHAITVMQHRSALLYQGADRERIIALFQLEDLYHEQLARLRLDPVLTRLIDRYRGLRVMRQDLHETILGFICSTQSNIPKIRMNLHLLAHGCGSRVGSHAHLPSPGVLLNHKAVVAARTGYRAKYLVQTNKLLTTKLLHEITSADYAGAHKLLCVLPGIGPKVADCVCLYALGHGKAFPVDVHIFRAMKVLFPRARLSTEKKARAFAQKRWGKDAGLAQQFIFQWARDDLVERKLPALPELVRT